MGLVASELVHGVQTDVEATRCGINGQNVDSLAVVRQGVAFAAVGRVPAWNGRSASDSGEARKRAERSVALGEQAVCTVRAGDGGQ